MKQIPNLIGKVRISLVRNTNHQLFPLPRAKGISFGRQLSGALLCYLRFDNFLNDN